jgi:hypothetical protein
MIAKSAGSGATAYAARRSLWLTAQLMIGVDVAPPSS